jgi:Domain of unknown function (DUF4261)
MTGPVNVDNFVFNFQAEHIFADSLFGNDAVGDFLRSRGYQKNALGNLMAEFTDADTVRKIQGDEALKEVLLDPNSRAGIVQHNSNASGGSQAGKNAFLRREIQGIIDSGASDPAKSTNGLRAFVGREVECGPYALPPGALAQNVLTIATYILQNHMTFADGATVGASDRPTGQIRTERSRYDGEMTPVYRLLLAEPQYH